MDVAACFRLLVPIRMFVISDRNPATQDILKMSSPAVAPFVSCQAVEQSSVRSALQINIERGVDPQSTFEYLIAAVLVFQIPADVFNEVRGERIRIFSDFEIQRLIAGFCCLLGGDLAVLEHGVDYQVASLECAIRVVDRRVVSRGFRKTGK